MSGGDEAILNLAAHFVDARVAEGLGGRTAIRTDERLWTYYDVANLSSSFASVLAGAEIRPEERVILALPDGAPFVGALFGILRRGAVAVMINPELPAELLTYFFDTPARAPRSCIAPTCQRSRKPRRRSRRPARVRRKTTTRSAIVSRSRRSTFRRSPRIATTRPSGCSAAARQAGPKAVVQTAPLVRQHDRAATATASSAHGRRHHASRSRSCSSDTPRDRTCCFRFPRRVVRAVSGAQHAGSAVRARSRAIGRRS